MDAKKDKPEEEKVIKCQICHKREAVTFAVRPFDGDTINVCNKCFNDLLDEEDE